MTERPQTWKKISAISQASRNPDKMSVTMVRSHHQQDEDETEVESDNSTKGTKRPLLYIGPSLEVYHKKIPPQ